MLLVGKQNVSRTRTAIISAGAALIPPSRDFRFRYWRLDKWPLITRTFHSLQTQKKINYPPSLPAFRRSKITMANSSNSRHGDFKQIEASRPSWSAETWTQTQTKNPSWKYGDGANDDGASLKQNHVEIDPYGEGRSPANNYKLLISGYVPRPIAFVSTISADGSSTNLAPYSYSQVVCHDPPLFIVGIAGGLARAKDTLKNILDTKECVINVVSEHFAEAANSCAVPAPHGISEWALSGLTPAPCSTVRCSRVKEAVFAVEGKLVDHKEYFSKTDPSQGSAVIVTIEGTRFWVREDALNKDKNLIDFGVLKPIGRIGGISYSRQVQGFELQRPSYEESVEKDPKAKDLVKPKHPSQI